MQRKNLPVLGDEKKLTNRADGWFRISHGSRQTSKRAVVIAKASTNGKRLKLKKKHPPVSLLAIDRSDLRANLAALFVEYADVARVNLSRPGDQLTDFMLEPISLSMVMPSLKKAVDLHQHVDVIAICRNSCVSIAQLLEETQDLGYRHIDFHLSRH